MPAYQRVSIQPIKELLRNAAPAKAADLDALFQRLSPVCELDRTEERIFFKADAGQNLIRIGTKCTIRLQVHSLAAGVVIAGIGTPGFENMSQAERRPLFVAADQLFTWAVGRELQQWIKQIEGYKPALATILQGAEEALPETVLASLSGNQRLLGEGVFRFALAFILLHELGHLSFGDQRCQGYWSIQQEKDADRFAAEWLLEGASSEVGNPPARRLNVLFGVSVALLWLTVLNVFLGRTESTTHPEPYDRLFQALDCAIERSDETEYQVVWDFVSTLLFNHMWSAGLRFDERDAIHMQGDSRDEVSYLIDRISKGDRLPDGPPA